MSSLWLGVFAALCSLLPLLVLAYFDPKRRRSRGMRQWSPSQVRAWRQGALWALVLVPMMLLLFFGKFVALLLWLSSVTVGGWLIAQGFNWRAPVE